MMASSSRAASKKIGSPVLQPQIIEFCQQSELRLDSEFQKNRSPANTFNVENGFKKKKKMGGAGFSEKTPVKVCLNSSPMVTAYVLSHSVLSDSLWPYRAVVNQAPLSMGFSRQESWSGLPFPPPRNLPNPRMESASPVIPALQAYSSQLGHREWDNK